MFFLTNKKKCPNNKKEMYNDKYRHTRDRLFGLALVREQPYNLKGGGGGPFR